MTLTTEARKLAELRAKTDRQLADLITGKLERGYALVRIFAEAKRGAGWASADEFATRAEAAYDEVVRLSSAICTLPEFERRRLNFGMERLRALLDRHNAMSTRVRAACS